VRVVPHPSRGGTHTSTRIDSSVPLDVLATAQPATDQTRSSRTSDRAMKSKNDQVKANESDGKMMSPQEDLIYQALETEIGGVDVYTTALECAQNPELRDEWEKYLDQTKNHVEIMRSVCTALGLDPDRETPGRKAVRTIGKALVEAMEGALKKGPSKASEILAAECVVLAETKDHANWSLIGKLVEQGSSKEKAALKSAHEEVEPEEDEHLYHTRGWARELWLDAMGLPAELPPPEEEEDVKSEEEAAEVKKRSFAKRE
jgi:rubrerythrin